MNQPEKNDSIIDTDLPGTEEGGGSRERERDDVREDVNNTNKIPTPLQVPSPLPFFVNGCKAPGIVFLSLLLLELMIFSLFQDAGK